MAFQELAKRRLSPKAQSGPTPLQPKLSIQRGNARTHTWEEETSPSGPPLGEKMSLCITFYVILKYYKMLQK